MGGPDRKYSITLAYSCAGRHPGIAISVATTSYPGKGFGAAVILCLVVQGIIFPLYVKWQRRLTATAAAPSAAEPGPQSRDRPP